MSTRPPGWRPVFADYLFLGLSTGTAFSPTDTRPLTPRAACSAAHDPFWIGAAARAPPAPVRSQVHVEHLGRVRPVGGAYAPGQHHLARPAQGLLGARPAQHPQ